MKLRVRLIGSGTSEDAFRVNFPTYTMLDCNYDDKWAIVDIPDTEHPFEGDGSKHPTVVKETDADYVIAVSEQDLKAWHKHLDARYKEHKGKFKVEFA